MGDFGIAVAHTIFYPAINDEARHSIAELLGIQLGRGEEVEFGILVAEAEFVMIGAILCTGLWAWRLGSPRA